MPKRLSTIEQPPPAPSLEHILTFAEKAETHELLPRRRWTIRLPETVASELEAIAEVKAVSINALVMIALDELLARQGRPRVSELAPWFAEYLQRVGTGTRKRRSSSGADFD